MSSKTDAVVSEHNTDNGTVLSYTTGFLLSIVLTMAAYMLVTGHYLASWSLVFALIGLAVVQLFVQVVFFLHLAKKSKPRWNLLVFGLMLVVVLIVVGGSLWIMYNLGYRMMPKTQQQVNQYLNSQAGF